MKCKHLTGFKVPMCLASEELIVPSLLELIVFCHGRPGDCPIYQEKEGVVLPNIDMHYEGPKEAKQKAFREAE